MGLPIARLILATNENDVLDEFFRTGRYRPRAAARDACDVVSPSMDISKASNFERFVFDLVGRDPAVVRALWSELDARRRLRPRRHAALASACARPGSCPGRSTHADRIATIRDVARALRRRRSIRTPPTASRSAASIATRRLPLICLETALPAKFAATIREALGREPERPPAYADLESRPQRVTVLPAGRRAVKAFIAEHAAAA